MIHVTVLLLEDTFPSTAVGPMEVFRHAGNLWNVLTGTPPAPRFEVTTASADGRAVRCDGGIRVQPDQALKDVRKTDRYSYRRRASALTTWPSEMRR